jgi:hypothetical protein
VAESKVVTIEGAARLARAGVSADDELIGVTEHGHAVYNFHKTIVVRLRGPRSDDSVNPLRGWMPPQPSDVGAATTGPKPRRDRKRPKIRAEQ